MKKRIFFFLFLINSAVSTSIPHPTFHVIIQRKAYSLCYDYQHKQPKWVYEHLIDKNLQGSADRKGLEFLIDFLIPKMFRASNKDYQASGYDRGHICPAGNALYDKTAMAETFYLSNISPQYANFNRGYWLKLEKHVRYLAQINKSIHIYSGPLYLPITKKNGRKYVQYEVIGNNNISVPTHYFKILFNDKKSLLEAYIVPNQNIDINTPLELFRVSLDRIEEIAGIIFFPN